MKRMVMLVAVIAICAIFNGCALAPGGSGQEKTIYYSATLYGGVNGSDGFSYGGYNDSGLNWYAGVSLTLFNHLPAVPAVPTFNTNRIIVNNSNTSTSSSSSSQKQDQSQNNRNSNSGSNSGNGKDKDKDKGKDKDKDDD